MGVGNVEEQRQWDSPAMWEARGHGWSEHFGGTDTLWNTHLFDAVKPFRGRRVLEIAPGHGRMTQYLAILASRLVVVDLNPSCIAATRALLGHHVAEYIVGDGLSLPGVPDRSQDLVFSFDSFVHMHAEVVQAYIREAARVLVPGGCGLIHHANLSGGQDTSFDNLSGRANMSPTLFASTVAEVGMMVLSQVPIDFSEVIDTITLFRKLA